MMPGLQAVTDANFDRVVESAGVPVLVGFWRPGCGHCRVLLTELAALQAEMADHLLVVTMNVDEQFQIPAELEITSLPALALYRQGGFERFVGGLGTKDALKKHVMSFGG